MPSGRVSARPWAVPWSACVLAALSRPGGPAGGRLGLRDRHCGHEATQRRPEGGLGILTLLPRPPDQAQQVGSEVCRRGRLVEMAAEAGLLEAADELLRASER